MSKVMIEGPEIGAAGRFNIVVKNADGSIKKDYGWQSNLITQAGLDAINSLLMSFQYSIDYHSGYIVIGTGSGTPSITDKKLFEPLTDLTNTSNNPGVSDLSLILPNDLKIKMDYLYPDGYAWGGKYFAATFTNIKNKNITELGITDRYYTYNYDLYTHAIIRDENGQPTAITVLSGEILQIRYEIYAFIPYVTKRGTIKLKKTPDMAIPEQYTEEEYDYQLQIFRAVNKTENGQYNGQYGGSYQGSCHQIKIPDNATEGPVDFDKWKVRYKTTNANGSQLNSNINDLFNPTHADNALFFVNMDQEYRTNNLSTVQKLSFSSSYTSDFLTENGKKLWFSSVNVEGYRRANSILWSPFCKDGQFKGSSNAYCYNSGNSGDNGLRALFFQNSTMGDENRYSDGYNFFKASLINGGNGELPNMLVVFSKKGTGEGIKKEWGWFLEITFGFNTVGIDLESVKIVNASMDTSAKVLNQTHTLDLTYEEGATYSVEIQSLVENVSAEELVSVNGLTLTQVAQSGSFNVKVTVSKEGMVPRTFTQSFTIASSN